KVMTLFHEDNQIEIHNSLLGQETVYYNGEEVSSKWSLFGKLHSFTVEENEELIEYKVTTLLHLHGVGFDIWRDGKPLLTFSS
ncbi:MAG: hypothetical protein AAF798_13035, partial [Bacteroidota bacterium]